jgi:hypothetical protein
VTRPTVRAITDMWLRRVEGALREA